MEQISSKDLEAMAVTHGESYQSMQDDLGKWNERSNQFLEQARYYVDAAERCFNAYLQIRQGMFPMDPIAENPISAAMNKPATVPKLPER